MIRTVIRPELYERIVCAMCGRDFTGHDRATGYCNVWRRAERPPYRLSAHVPVGAAVGWRLRQA